MNANEKNLQSTSTKINWLLKGVYVHKMYVPPSYIEPQNIDDVYETLLSKIFGTDTL